MLVPTSDVISFTWGNVKFRFLEQHPKGFDSEVLGGARGICMSKKLPRASVMWALSEANIRMPGVGEAPEIQIG